MICKSAEPGGAIKATQFQIAWPATVESTDGRWLKIRDDGGYTPNGLVGWVYADDVLRFNEAEQHYADKISESPQRCMYWLDGICFETNNEPALALADYKAATDPKSSLPADNRLDDAEIRMGRLLAANQFARQSVQNADVDGRNDWYDCFNKAYGMNSQRPILFLEWGNAFRLSCSCAPVPEKQKTPGGGNPSDNENGTTNAERGAQQPIPNGAGMPNVFSTQSNALPPNTPPPNTPPPEPLPTPKPPDPPTITALRCYKTAESLSKRWWSVPLARAELLLNSCTNQQEGEIAPALNDDLTSAEVKEMLKECGMPAPNEAATAAGPTSSDKSVIDEDENEISVTDEIANKKSATNEDAKKESATGSGTSHAKCSKVCRDALLAAALHCFDQAIYLQPKSPDAYRDRAEVLWLQSRLEPARQSAMTACVLGDFPPCQACECWPRFAPT